MNYKLVAFAMDFASFLMQKTRFNNEVNNIILFGSVSRGEAGRESDIDIFVDINKESSIIIEDIQKCLNKFMDSSKYNNYWKMFDIKNEIKLTIGRLDKWKELQSSIASNGIALYGKFKINGRGNEHKIIFAWENVKPNSKRVLFNKQLFGYKYGNKFYKGLMQKYSGERMGKGSIIVPLEYYNVFYQLFKKYKIAVKIRKFSEY